MRNNNARLNKTSKEKVAVAKEAASENLYDKIEMNGPKIIHRLAKTRHRRSKDIDRIPFVKDIDGKILCEDEQIKKRWENYFNGLLNNENIREELSLPVLQTHPLH